jgi:hypothetical protein
MEAKTASSKKVGMALEGDNHRRKEENIKEWRF